MTASDAVFIRYRQGVTGETKRGASRPQGIAGRRNCGGMFLDGDTGRFSEALPRAEDRGNGLLSLFSDCGDKGIYISFGCTETIAVKTDVDAFFHIGAGAGVLYIF